MKCLAARFLLLIFSITALCTFLLAHSFERTQSAPLSQATPANPEASSPFRTIDTIGDISVPHIGSWDEHSEARVFMDGYLLMGQAWGDYNNDGYIDLYVTGGQGASSLYENQGDGHFAHSAFADTVALPNSWTGGATWVDYNNDGWRDLYVLVHGVNVLFHNNEGTGFTDVTALAGVGDVGKSSTATWGDFDGDADLDLYVTNWSCYPACDPVDHTQAQDRFYRNNGPDDQGNITFTDVSAWFTEEKLLGAGFAATFVDIDDDRDPDLYVVNDKLQNPIGNVLWRNDGPNDDGRCGPDPDRWCWTDISETSGAMSGLHGMGLAIGDYDEDLDLDIYITNKERFGQLLQNDGSGTFVNGTTAANLPTTVTDVIGWGTTFFDYDNDGRLDLYAATTGSVKLNDLQGALGMHFPFADQLFHNDGGIFTDVTPTDWQTTPQPTVGIAYADYDNDGRLDLVRGIWNVGYELLHNQSPTAAANNWLRIQLIGGGPVNRDAVGTRVYVNLTGGRRLMQEVVNGSALGAGNDLTLHFGLGEERVISVMVVWPDGLKRIYPVVPHNQLWRVVYPTVKDDPVVTQLRDAASEPFVDVSVAAGIAAQHQGNWTMFKPGFTSGYLGIGQAWGDYNNDGWVDLYVTGNELPNVLFQNRGDGTFTRSPLSDDVALPNVRSGGVTWADYNNDGYTDLYVLNQGANTLFRNDNGTGFTDVTATTGVGDVGKGSSATWADYDGDGFLDLYVVNWSCHPECDPIDLTQAEDGLYHNNGDGTFTDVSALLAVERLQGAGFTASFGDFDDDGDADLYVINDALMNPIGNVYWRNDGPDTTGACGGWCWTDASAENGAGTVVEGMGLAIGDYDNDLDLDFYYSNKVNPGELLQNDAGRFVDVAGGAGIDTINGTTVGWGASFLDYDNDGWLDLFMATTEFRRTDPNKPPDGMHFGHPNLLFHNRGEANIAGTNAPVFTNVTPATWYEVPRASMGIAAADYDHDGRVDFVTGDWSSGYLLYRNVDPAAAADGGPNNWFTVQLTGDGPINRDAVGARVYLTDSNGKKQLREVRIGSSLGAGEETALHFGLGDATIREVEVVWPDGLQITVVNLPVNQRWALTYPNRETETVAIAPTTSPTAMATPPTPTTASTPTAPPMATATTVIAPPTTAPLPTMTPTTVPTVPLQPSPTTQSPITQSPITQSPITQSPITQSPITQSPITQSPITQSPITQSPITQLPPITGTQHNRTIQDNDALLATAWFDLYLQLIETTEGFAPPVAARAIGYGGVTFYEALVNGLPAYEALAGQLNGLSGLPQPQPNTRYHWPTVANSAMAQITKSLFSNTNAANQDAIDLLALQFADHYRVGLDAATFDRSVQFGRAVAVAIYGWSVTDGGHEAQFHNFASDYTSPVGDGMWQSTPPGHAAALLPHWSNNRPMVLRTDHACVAEPPIPYSTAPDSPFMALTQEVYDTVRHLTPEQYTIARFWADDPGKTPTPPGHSLAIATTILRQTNASLALAAETYARLGIAVNDAFIGCWQAKYQYNRIRPITAIQALIDPAWNNPAVTDPVLTPPFPEYTSGHSVQSGAVAEVLTSLFGDITFTDRTHVERGLLPRTFDSFWAMANEAAISRLYGGIHYRDAIDAGLVQGQCIGQQVVALQLRRE